MQKEIEVVSFLLREGVIKEDEIRRAKSFKDIEGFVEEKKFKCSNITCEAHWQKILVLDNSNNCRLCGNELISIVNFNF